MLHPFERGHAAIEASSELRRLNLVVLPGPEPTESQWNLVLKGLEAVSNDLLDKFAGWHQYEGTRPIRQSQLCLRLQLFLLKSVDNWHGVRQSLTGTRLRGQQRRLALDELWDRHALDGRRCDEA